MFVIMVYDVNTKRVGKALRIARRYMTWVQNSVFEGEMTPGELKSLKREMNDVIDTNGDSVLFYTWSSAKYTSRDVIGAERASVGNFI